MHLRVIYDLNSLSVLGSWTLWSLNLRFIQGLNADHQFVVQGVLPIVYKQDSEIVKKGNPGRVNLHQHRHRQTDRQHSTPVTERHYVESGVRSVVPTYTLCANKERLLDPTTLTTPVSMYSHGVPLCTVPCYSRSICQFILNTSASWQFCIPDTQIFYWPLNKNTSRNHKQTYLITPWCRVLLQKLTGLQLVKRFPAFHGTRRSITALTSVRQLSVSWASPIQSIYPHPTSWRSIVILSTHLCLGLPSGLFPSGFPTKSLYTTISSPIRATCPAHHILLDFITSTILGEKHKSFSSSLCNNKSPQKLKITIIISSSSSSNRLQAIFWPVTYSWVVRPSILWSTYCNYAAWNLLTYSLAMCVLSIVSARFVHFLLHAT